MGTKRAIKGGEVGANGEFYEGGQFIATSPETVKGRKRPISKGKKQIYPYKWELPASPSMFAIFAFLDEVNFVYAGAYGTPGAFTYDAERAATISAAMWGKGPEDPRNATRLGFVGVDLIALMEKFNAGEFWIDTADWALLV